LVGVAIVVTLVLSGAGVIFVWLLVSQIVGAQFGQDVPHGEKTGYLYLKDRGEKTARSWKGTERACEREKGKERARNFFFLRSRERREKKRIKRKKNKCWNQKQPLKCRLDDNSDTGIALSRAR